MRVSVNHWQGYQTNGENGFCLLNSLYVECVIVETVGVSTKTVTYRLKDKSDLARASEAFPLHIEWTNVGKIISSTDSSTIHTFDKFHTYGIH